MQWSREAFTSHLENYVYKRYLHIITELLCYYDYDADDDDDVRIIYWASLLLLLLTFCFVSFCVTYRIFYNK